MSLSPKAQAMLSQVKQSFAKRESIPVEYADRLLTLLDNAPRECLEAFVRERVKFCYHPARRRLMDKFGMTAEQVDAL